MGKSQSFIKFARAISKNPYAINKLIGESEDIIKMNVAHLKTIYVVTKPEAVQYILNSPNYIRNPLALNSARDLLEGGIDVSHDYLSEDIQALIETLTAAQEKEFITKSVDTIQNTLNSWESFVVENRPLNLRNELSCLFISLYLDTFLSGIHLDNIPAASDLIHRTFKYFSPLNYYLKFLGKLPFSTPFRHYLDCKKKAIDIGFQLMERSMQQDSSDFNFIRFLANRSKHPSTFAELDINMKRHLAGRAFATLISSTHNNIGLLSHLLVHLSSDPAIKDNICREIDSVVGNRNPNYDDLQKLVYTRAVFLEATRLFPALLNIFRMSKDNDTIGGIKIKKGTDLIIPVLVCHKLSKYWPNPESFDPSRFLQPLSPEQKILYLGFSHGMQGCIAKRFSINQGTLFLVMLLQRYRLELPPGTSLALEKKLQFFLGKLNGNIEMRLFKA